ncbi:MAG: hypothetical protein JWM42_3133 [Burkholderia sp.]|nr:hypothetical protein [Burkholderia sp.]
MATTSNTFASKKKNRLSATRPLRPAKLTNLFLRGALVRESPPSGTLDMSYGPTYI